MTHMQAPPPPTPKSAEILKYTPKSVEVLKLHLEVMLCGHYYQLIRYI